MLTQPEFCEALLDQTLKFWMDWFRVFLDEVGDVVDVIMIGDDLAGQKGPLFRPDFYRRVVKPRHKQLVQYIRSRTAAKIWYHTCGACVAYIPDLLDNGIDILNPVQIGASRDGACRLEGPLRRPPGVLGRRDRRPARACRGPRPKPSASTCGGTWNSGSPAAATCSTTSTTFRRAFRRRTSSPCTTPPMNSGFISRDFSLRVSARPSRGPYIGRLLQGGLAPARDEVQVSRPAPLVERRAGATTPRAAERSAPCAPSAAAGCGWPFG